MLRFSVSVSLPWIPPQQRRCIIRTLARKFHCTHLCFHLLSGLQSSISEHLSLEHQIGAELSEGAAKYLELHLKKKLLTLVKMSKKWILGSYSTSPGVFHQKSFCWCWICHIHTVSHDASLLHLLEPITRRRQFRGLWRTRPYLSAVRMLTHQPLTEAASSHPPETSSLPKTAHMPEFDVLQLVKRRVTPVFCTCTNMW